MAEQTSSTPLSVPSAKTKQPRARSLPSSGPFRFAAFCSSAHYLGLIVSATALVWLLRHPGAMASRILVEGLIFSAVAWLIAFFKRRSTLCPLCKGTPLLNTGALPHARAWRMWPCNHGTTAILSIIACQKFRCMYCGSDFDLLKPRTRILYGDSTDGKSED